MIMNTYLDILLLVLGVVVIAWCFRSMLKDDENKALKALVIEQEDLLDSYRNLSVTHSEYKDTAKLLIKSLCRRIDLLEQKVEEEETEHKAYLHEIGQCGDDCYACRHPYKP
jgi:hypothetical protein